MVRKALGRITHEFQESCRKNRADIQGLVLRQYPEFILNNRVNRLDGEIPVFVFHDVNQEDFDRQLRYLKENGYHTVESADVLYAHLSGERAIKPRSVLLTFDDGLASLYAVAFPLLKRYGVHAVGFLVPSLIGKEHFCTWDQIQEMHKSGVIDFQSHTLFHRYAPDWPRLIPCVDGPEGSNGEVRQYPTMLEDYQRSREIIEEKLGKEIRHLCYPAFDGTELSTSASKAAGYVSNFLGTLFGRKTNRIGSDPFQIVRLSEEYLLRLPGSGRVTLSQIVAGRVHRCGRPLMSRLLGAQRSCRPTEGRDVNVSITRDMAAFEALKSDWSNLLERSTTKTPFMTFEWTMAWWRHFGRGAKLLIFVARKAGRVIGIAPLMVSRRFALGIPYRELEFIASGSVPGVTSKGMSDRLDMMVDVEHQAEGIRTLVRAILQSRGDWDLVNLRPVPEVSATIMELRHAAVAIRMNCKVLACSGSRYQPVSSDWETYIRSRSRTAKKSYKYSESQFARELDLRLDVVDDPEVAVRLFPQIVDESVANSPVRKEGGDLFCRGSVRTFFMECLAGLGGQKALKVFLLYKGNVIISHMFAFLLDQTLWLYNSAYNRAYKKLSPGRTVWWLVMRWGFRHGLREVDLLSGDHEFKHQLAERERVDQRIVVSKRGLRIRLVVLIEVAARHWLRKQKWAAALDQQIRSFKNRLRRA